MEITIVAQTRRNNRMDRGRLVPQLLVGGPTIYWSPNFLAVVFKKQEISQQVVTRMQDLASEFSKIFRGDNPGPSQPLPLPTPSPAFGRARGASALVLGPKPWFPSTFQPWLHP